MDMRACVCEACACALPVLVRVYGDRMASGRQKTMKRCHEGDASYDHCPEDEVGHERSGGREGGEGVRAA